ncbi:MAG: ferredoxin family protein, partial [Planctomycetota bacterium]
FPQHKTPTIAGSPEVGGPMKIDLSKLFGAPDPGAPGAAKAVDVAVLERDAALVDAGRDTVGKEVGLEKRQSREAEERPKDDLDELIDQLDAIEL